MTDKQEEQQRIDAERRRQEEQKQRDDDQRRARDAASDTRPTGKQGADARTVEPAQRYRVLERSFINDRLYEPGEEVDYVGDPSANLEPIGGGGEAPLTLARSTRTGRAEDDLMPADVVGSDDDNDDARHRTLEGGKARAQTKASEAENRVRDSVDQDKREEIRRQQAEERREQEAKRAKAEGKEVDKTKPLA
jgi:hypothetical protein